MDINWLSCRSHLWLLIHAAEQANLHPEIGYKAFCAPASCYSWFTNKQVHSVILVFLPVTSVTQGITMPSQNQVTQSLQNLKRASELVEATLALNSGFEHKV